MVCCVFFLFASSPSNIAFVATKQFCRSAVRTRTPCGVRYVACHVQVALLFSFLGPPVCQWCSDWRALGCSAVVAFDCVCLSHVSGWLRMFEVSAVPLGVSCFSVVSGRGILCGPPERWGAGRLFSRGIRPQLAAETCAHASCSTGREPLVWMQIQLIGNRQFWCFQNERALLSASLRALTLPTTYCSLPPPSRNTGNGTLRLAVLTRWRWRWLRLCGLPCRRTAPTRETPPCFCRIEMVRGPLLQVHGRGPASFSMCSVAAPSSHHDVADRHLPHEFHG